MGNHCKLYFLILETSGSFRDSHNADLEKAPWPPEHSAVKCYVIGPKMHVPMETKVGKVPNKLYQGHLHSMWTFRQKKFGPRGPHGGPKVPRAHVPGSKFFLAQIL